MGTRGIKHLSEEEVEHVAWLAHIELAEDEKVLFTEQFNRILDFFRKIDEAETEGVPPTYHVLEIVNVWRSDEGGESLPREEILRNAPKKEKGFFRSPRMV